MARAEYDFTPTSCSSEEPPVAQAEPEKTGGPPIVIRASQDKDIADMLAIYRRHIRKGVDESVEEYHPLQPDDLRRRRKNMRNHHLPHLVATRNGVLVGYAYAVLFRKRPAYRYTAKHSIYVHHEHLREGIGQILLPALIDACAAAGFRQMIGYIDSANIASLELHKKFGFRHVGVLTSVGFRYGRWSDSIMVQRSLGPGDLSPPGTLALIEP
jgi:L-amino acid N-acyltransferase YncA